MIDLGIFLQLNLPRYDTAAGRRRRARAPAAPRSLIDRRDINHFVHTPISVFWFLNLVVYLLVFRAYGSVWR